MICYINFLFVLYEGENYSYCEGYLCENSHFIITRSNVMCGILSLENVTTNTKRSTDYLVVD